MSNSAVPWSGLFGVAAWRLWNWQNDALFRDEDWYGNKILDIHNWASEINRTLISLGQSTGNERMKVSRMIGWSPPKDGWVKLNTDGAFRASDGMAMASGLVRDGCSNWVVEFSA